MISSTTVSDAMAGKEMYQWAKDIFPICRSITGNGVRETLDYFSKFLPELKIHEVSSGTKVFDWIVPDEWNIKGAYIEDDKGERIVDFCNSNLHVLNYSEPVDAHIGLEELQDHLYSLPDQPDAIPYVTSYYKRRWGFCMTEKKRQALRDCIYHVKIDSTLEPGSLTYGELLLPGDTEEEILLSSNVCHPSLANNEVSGAVMLAGLGKWLNTCRQRRYTYRIVFVPETIGAITYLSKNLDVMKSRTVAGYALACVGDDRSYSFLPSRKGGTLSDKVAQYVLKSEVGDYCKYTFLDRGSDERQYCSPGVDLPIASIMRTKYGMFPEYHTSLDDLSVISPSGLQGAFHVLRKCIELLEANLKYEVTSLCEPCLGAKNLYPSVGTKRYLPDVRAILNFIAYADGEKDLIDIAEIIDQSVENILTIADTLERAGVVSVKN